MFPELGVRFIFQYFRKPKTVKKLDVNDPVCVWSMKEYIFVYRGLKYFLRELILSLKAPTDSIDNYLLLNFIVTDYLVSMQYLLAYYSNNFLKWKVQPLPFQTFPPLRTLIFILISSVT